MSATEKTLLQLVEQALRDELPPGVRIDDAAIDGEGHITVTFASRSPEATQRVREWCRNEGIELIE